jgi:hypothetical protein
LSRRTSRLLVRATASGVEGRSNARGRVQRRSGCVRSRPARIRRHVAATAIKRSSDIDDQQGIRTGGGQPAPSARPMPSRATATTASGSSFPKSGVPYTIVVGVDPSASRAGVAARARTRSAWNGGSRRANPSSSWPGNIPPIRGKAAGGDLGFVHRGRLMEELETALSAMRLAEVRPSAQKSFADVKDQLVRD